MQMVNKQMFVDINVKQPFPSDKPNKNQSQQTSLEGSYK